MIGIFPDCILSPDMIKNQQTVKSYVFDDKEDSQRLSTEFFKIHKLWSRGGGGGGGGGQLVGIWSALGAKCWNLCNLKRESASEMGFENSKN